MLKLLLLFLAFFTAFAAGGYGVGRSVVTAEPYMLATIANATTVKLNGNQLTLELAGNGQRPYWQLNLSNNRPRFQSTDSLLRSFDGKTLSAESNLMLTFASGGAATTTAATVYKQAIEAKKTGDWKKVVAMVAGGVTGYLSGYYTAIYLAKPSDKEVQLALRNPETVEKVKKYVFLSLMHARGLQHGPIAAEREAMQRACPQYAEAKASDSDSKARTAFIECFSDAWFKSGVVERDIYQYELLESASEALSNDKVNLKGHEFLIFALQDVDHKRK